MAPIDAAFDRFKAVAAEVAEYINSVDTEADTRLKIIDRLLVEMLGWPLAELLAEDFAEGGFADYACRVQERYRLIVEAKRDGRSLGCEGRPAGASFKLSGPVFASEAAKEGIAQAIKYSGAKNAEVACITNGREWIVFRGNRLGDGLDTRDGSAFVFSNLIDVEDKFALFYDLLSYEAAAALAYRPHFQEAEGQPIRASVFSKSVRAPGSAHFVPGGDLAADIDKVMSAFFQRLTGDQDPDLIDLCFVETAESHHADTQLAKIAEDIVARVQALDTGRGDALTSVIERVSETRSHEFVLIVGTKGAGKSTFISRFFSLVLPRRIAALCVVLRLDLGEATGDSASLVTWLQSELLGRMESTLFPEGASFNELQGMFFDEYTRLRKGPWESLYARDRDEFHIRFGDRIERMRQEAPADYVQGLLRHVVNLRQMLPVIVFDNADHHDIDFQQKVYQYARSIFERGVCLILLPITDRTSWQLTKHGALQSFEHEALFLPTPPTDEIIRKRIDFLERRIEADRERPADSYFLSRGIRLNIEDLTAFSRALQRVFLQTSETSRWMGDLANHDVRRTLKLARALVASPHLEVEDLVKAYLAGSAVEVPPWRAARAIIRAHYDIYPMGQHDFVQNLFALNQDPATTPLLGLRVLQLMSDVPDREHEGRVLDVSEVVAYGAGMNIDDRAVTLWIDAMLKTGLLLNYDPTIQDVSRATLLEISPSGRQHLHWANGNYQYLTAMADVTPLLSETTFTDMRDKSHPNQWRPRTKLFIEYLLKEDTMYCIVPPHGSYQSQARIRPSLSATAEKIASPPDARPTSARRFARSRGPRR